MTHFSLPDDLAIRGKNSGTIIMLVLDGLGGLPHPDTGRTELESARTPNFDALASRSSLGMLMPVGHGVTPGSGPGHLALFGYDPIESMIGRGVLSALGVGLALEPGDVAARLNLANVDVDGLVTDRRAGRPTDEDGRRVIGKVKGAIKAPDGVEVTLVHEKEHRAVLVMRGAGLGAQVGDTDPQRTGLPPVPAKARHPDSERTAEIVRDLLEQTRGILSDEPVANAFLARGFAQYVHQLRVIRRNVFPVYLGHDLDLGRHGIGGDACQFLVGVGGGGEVGGVPDDAEPIGLHRLEDA